MAGVQSSRIRLPPIAASTRAEPTSASIFPRLCRVFRIQNFLKSLDQVVAVPVEKGFRLLGLLAPCTLSHRFDGSLQRWPVHQLRYLDARQLAVQHRFAVGRVLVERLQVSHQNLGCFKDVASRTPFADWLVAPEPEAVPFSRVGED